jgi:biotin transport system substrate-specific component
MGGEDAVKRDPQTMAANRPEVLVVDAPGYASAAGRHVVLGALLVVAGIGVLAASAWLSVPFYPVPLTMQTLSVLLVGGLLGPRRGLAAVAGYLALGLAGAPVFHGGLGGPAVLAGPTGGYLVGFLPAVLLMGLAARGALGAARQLRPLGQFLVLAAGAVSAEVVIYCMGVPWLALVGGLGVREAAAVGLMPFLLGDLLKAAVAVGAVRGGRSALARWGSLPF